MPSYAIKIRPADLPGHASATRSWPSSLACSKIDVGDINAAIDGSPGSRFDLVRIAQGVPRDIANLIAEETSGAARRRGRRSRRNRRYLDGTLMSQIVGYTGPDRRAESSSRLKDQGYLPDDLLGKTGVESTYEDAAPRRRTGARPSRSTRSVAQVQVLQTTQQMVPGDSLAADDRHRRSRSSPSRRSSGRCRRPA